MLEESLERIPGLQGLSTGRTRKLKEGERRRIAVLFLDLKGFTSISEKLDHEVVHSLVSGVMSVLSRVVESFGGYVDKFEGDRVMALFGARVSAENDSARAVGCARRMLDVLEELGPVFPDGNCLSARIGIDFGPVTVGPDPSGHLTAIGGVTNLASRIEELAEVGTILVTRTVREECGALFRWEDLGEIEVRGLAAPAHVCRPTGPGDVCFERWQRAERLAGSPLIGRSRQMKSIRDAFDAAMSEEGAPSLVLVVGDAGIGKSRLVHEFIAGVPDVEVLHGHALAYAQPPYWLWISLIRSHLGIEAEGPEWVPSLEEKLGEVAAGCPDDRRRRVLENSIPLLSRLISLGHLGYHSNSVTEHSALIQAQKAFVEALCASKKVLLVLEDLHWADEGSLGVLEKLLPLDRALSPLEILVTTRPPAPSWEEIDFSPVRVDVGPLEKEDVRELVGYLLSSSEKTSVSDELVEFVTEVGKGNPFVVEELVLGLLDTGGLQQEEDGSWSLVVSPDHIDIPSSIQSISQARIDRLPPDERKLLQYSSVLGVEFTAEMLEALLEGLSVTGFDCTAILSSLAAKGFLVEADPGRYTFRHMLVQRSAYGTLLRHNLRILHRAAALSIEKLFTGELEAMSPVIFAHWEAAGDMDRMVEWGRKAMSKIYESGQIEESMNIGRKILEWTEGSDKDAWYDAHQKAQNMRKAVLMMRGESDMGSAIITEMIRHAREKNDPGWELEALRAKAQLHLDRGELEEFEETIELAMEKALQTGEGMRLAQLKVIMANYLSDTTQPKRAEEYYLDGIAGLETYGEPSQIGSALVNLSNLYSKMGKHEKSLEYSRKAIAIYEATDDLQSMGYSLNSMAISYAVQGMIDEAEAMFLRAMKINVDIGNRIQEGTILGNLGIISKRRGDFETAIDRYTTAVEIAQECDNQRAEAISLANLANLNHMAGSDDRAMECAETALQIATAISDMGTACHAWSAIGLIRLDSRMPEAALEAYAEALGLVEEFGFTRGAIEDFDDFRDALEAEGLNPRIPSNWSEGEPEGRK